MSTLSTFANFADLATRPDRGKSLMDYDSAADKAESAKPSVMNKVAERADVKATKDPVKVAKAKERLANISKIRTGKNRNKIIAASVLSGLGLTGLGGAAYLNRNSNRRSEMSGYSAYANFAATQLQLPLGIEPEPVKKKLNRTDKTANRVKNANEARAARTAEDQNKIRESQKAFRGQRAVESNIDAGGDIYKGAKGMDYITRTGALLGSPERNLIAAGKKSKNELVQNIAKGAEGFGRLGYKQGAIGTRGVLNKVVGRTATGKVVRLGAAGLGLSAIGGAMKRNRQERG